MTVPGAIFVCLMLAPAVLNAQSGITYNGSAAAGSLQGSVGVTAPTVTAPGITLTPPAVNIPGVTLTPPAVNIPGITTTPPVVTAPTAGTTRQAMPQLLMADGSGLPVSLNRYRGQVTVVNFWSMSCGSCLQGLITLNRLQHTFNGQALSVVTIDEDQVTVAVTKNFLQRQTLTNLKVFSDPGASVANALGLRGLPSSIVIDKHGLVALNVEGPVIWDSPAIIRQLKGYVAEP